MQVERFQDTMVSPSSQDSTVFAWLGALRDELVGHGVTVGAPRQSTAADALVVYRQQLHASDSAYVFECKLQEEEGVVLRAMFYDSADQLLLSYRIKLGASADDTTDVLARRLGEARNRIPLIARCFDQVRETGSLMH